MSEDLQGAVLQGAVSDFLRGQGVDVSSALEVTFSASGEIRIRSYARNERGYFYQDRETGRPAEAAERVLRVIDG